MVVGKLIPLLVNAALLILIEETVSAEVPLFAMTNVLLILLPGIVPPRSVLSDVDGVLSPVTISLPFPLILISGAFTVTLKLQVDLLPARSVTSNVLVVVPIGKVEPDGKPAFCTTLNEGPDPIPKVPQPVFELPIVHPL